jgi:HD-GYP domain-containing protein (c-di-GMP phosphodiesterase class II)
VTTRFRTRAFLICFIPFAMLLAGSFWMIQRFVQSTVRDGLHTSLRESQVAIANIHAKGDLQNNRFLKVAGENSALKAGMQLLLANPHSDAARRTVEDQLRELGEHMGFDFMLISAPDGTPLAGVVRQSAAQSDARSQLVPFDASQVEPGAGFLRLDGRIFQVASVPVDQSDENIGHLSVGEYFDFSDLTTLVVLAHEGKVIESNIPRVPAADLERALAGCGNKRDNDQAECDLRLEGSNWISLPMQSYGDGYSLLSLENVDEATAPIQSRLHKLFLTLALICVVVAFLSSIGSSSSIVEPLAVIVSTLRNAVRTGKLPELQGHPSSILEIQELAEIYNRAAASVRAAGENLETAYLEFVGSLANALDARDQYTAGHSWRVSQLSCATASALQLDAEEVERIRIGALLHDIGKIGIADAVLQKPGRLTDAEFALVKQHPVIGRRILEGVHGFAPFLAAVELHHENWDGTGYPKGQSREETPMAARIIHVSDAYDAMTTDRSYRRAMSHEKAIAILLEYAGIQFDPGVVHAFVNLPREVLALQSAARPIAELTEQPAAAVAE